MVESYLINKQAKAVNVLNENDGVILSLMHSLLLDEKKKKNIKPFILPKLQVFHYNSFLFKISKKKFFSYMFLL